MKYCLIVEDDRVQAFLVQRHIVKMGFITSYCENPFDAIEQIKKGVVDILVTDIRMPLMGGIELIKHARKSSKMPIVAITSVDDVVLREEVFKAGADYLLLKPFTESEIKNIFTKWLS
jgi:DNA-binding response OmpR family regulator